MQIKLKSYGKTKSVKTDKKTIESLLKGENINTESFLVKKNGRFVPAEDSLKDGDEIELINIVSSG